MKVVQLIDTLDAGGAERMAVNLANALVAENVTSYLCATRRGGALENDLDGDVNFFLLHKKNKLDIKAFYRFINWIKKEKIDVLHAHSTSILLAVIARLSNRKLKVVWHDHYGLSDLLEQRPSKSLKVLAKHIDFAITVNEKLANWSKEVLHIKNVIFLNNFAAISETSQNLTFLKGEEGKRVICLANLRPQKNHIELIKAFRKSLKKFPEWSLHIVGKSFEDDYNKAVLDTIKENNLEKAVYVYGSCNDVKHILNQATIGVLSSISEGLPVSLLEYANCALPVIVTNVGQCMEVVGDYGIVINDVNKELPEAFMQLYALSKDDRECMGSRFRESVLKKYSKEAFLQKLMSIYKALIP